MPFKIEGIGLSDDHPHGWVRQLGETVEDFDARLIPFRSNRPSFGLEQPCINETGESVPGESFYSAPNRTGRYSKLFACNLAPFLERLVICCNDDLFVDAGFGFYLASLFRGETCNDNGIQALSRVFIISIVVERFSDSG